MKKAGIILIFLSVMFSVSGCFRDLGNYDYTPVNEAVIGEDGFGQAYDVRRGMDSLRISPEIRFTKDADASGNYSYEWVAVGQHFYRGQRFVIGCERNLECKVELQAEEYILYFKVTDLETDLVFSREVALNVRSTNTLGWLLGGENENGEGQVDMLSISRNILYLKNTLGFEDGLSIGPVDLVWVDNDEWTGEERLYVNGRNGAYLFDRSSFVGSPYTSIRYQYALLPDPGQNCMMTDNQKVSDKRQVVIIDSKAHIVSSERGLLEGTFCTYDNVNEFRVGPKMICNQTDVQGIRTFVFYDADNCRFSYISGLTVKGMKIMGDADGDSWSWETKKDFSSGLEMIDVVNSFFSNGQAVAVMRNPENGDIYLYCITAPRTDTPVKNGRYKVDPATAPGFADSPSYAMTTNHGFLIYASGNRLYGLNFRGGVQTSTLLHEFDAPVTCIKMDLETEGRYRDEFLVATYDDARPRSGILYRFRVEDDPDVVAASMTDTWDEGFLKINTIKYKAF